MQLKTPKFWQKNNLLTLLLTPVSWLYLLFHRVIQFTYSPRKFNKKLICIGNLSVGGAGKTPFAICLAKEMQRAGLRVAFASKNYIGNCSYPKQVAADDTAKLVSDEPLLLAKIAPSFVAKSRQQAIELACSSEAEVVIVDDGLQSGKIQYNYKIIVVDSVLGFGNKRLLPAGPLRDSLDCLNDVDLIVQVDGNMDSIPELGKFHNKLCIVKRHFVHNLDFKKNYVAFAGIAYPSKFFDSLKMIGIKVVKTIGFPDHYKYEDGDIEELQRTARQFNAELVTTEKDIVKINKDISVLKMMLEFDNAESATKIIRDVNEKN